MNLTLGSKREIDKEDEKEKLPREKAERERERGVFQKSGGVVHEITPVKFSFIIVEKG